MSQTSGGVSDSWRLAPRTEPIRRNSPHLTYDAARGVVVLFGGIICQGATCFAVNDTWTWDGINWRQQHPVAAPPARYYSSIAYDEARQVVVLFGGAICDAVSCRGVNDTWTWDGTNWSQQQPATSPSARYSQAMAYDAKHKQVVLFSGCLESCPAMLPDTWTWDGSNWTLQQTSNSPPERAGASLSFDPIRGVTVLFGGATPASTTVPNEGIADYNDTWTWDGSIWAKLSPATSPEARSSTVMVFDEATQNTVLFGGLQSIAAGVRAGMRSHRRVGSLQSTWTWDGNTWTEHVTDPAPAFRLQHAMAYDAARNEVVLFGGQSNAQAVNDTWTWDGTTWTDRTPAPTTPVPRVGPGFVYDGARGDSVLFGGTVGDFGAYSDTWIWDGTAWSEQHPSTSPGGRYGPGIAYDALRREVVLFGGAQCDGCVVEADTWAWDGTTWTERTPATVPPERAYPGVAYDGATHQVVMFGGAYYIDESGWFYRDDTWAWDGTTWTELFPSTSPSERSETAMAYDAATRQVVLFGGGRDSARRDTWTWDGTTWTQQPPAVSPPAGKGTSMVYDPFRRVLALFATDGTTWRWNGTAWMPVATHGSPPARRDAGMAYDVVRRAGVLFGGQGTQAPLDDTWLLLGNTWHQAGEATLSGTR